MLVGGLLQRFQRSGVEEKGHDLDEIMVLCLYQLVQKYVSLDGHSDSPALKFCAIARKLKV